MPITLQTDTFRYVIGDDGRNRHFIEKASGCDHLSGLAPSCCALVRIGPREVGASAASFAAGRLRLEFGEAGVAAVVRVDTHPGYLLFTVEAVTGAADELRFVNIPTTLRARADEPFSATCIALNLQTNVEELPGPQEHLWAAAYRRFGFVGAMAGLAAAPFAGLRAILTDMVSRAPGVPHSPYGGPWAMAAEIPYGSYLFGTPTEQTVDAWIDLCRQLGFSQIDFCGCLNYGDYQPFAQMYPNGRQSVKAVTDRLHAAGILAGLHTMSFSISKNCDWVTPVPDARLASERAYTLAADVSAVDSAIALVEPTGDLPRYIGYYVRRSMTLQIDDELIEFARVQDTVPYAVAGCKRGACGTVPAAHAKGAQVRHLKQCWGCFVPDGDSTLFGEVAERIATVIDECGFDFTYLDGLDGAHVIGGEENRWHYGAKFAFEVFRRLRRPIMVEMATFHHHLWFVRSRMQAWDHTIRAHKRFIDIHVASNDGARRLFMPLHLGWSRVLAWLGAEHDVTYRDDAEAMWCRGLGTDASYSLQAITPDTFATEPWLRQLAPLIRTYETLRRERYFPESVKAKLREPGAEYTLTRAADGEWQFMPVQYARHKVEDVDGITNVWHSTNRFGPQPLRLRLEPLMACGPYDAPGNPVLTDFSQPGEFGPLGETIQILNSGKLYGFVDAPPGLSAGIRPASEPTPCGSPGGYWTATNAGLREPVLSSAPDDAYSLLDHAERIYRPRVAAWIRLGREYSPALDLSAHQGLGVWVHGDGQGELINIRPATVSSADSHADHYITVDFTGWRYVELVEPEAERFEDHSWPYGRCLYKTYREVQAFGNTVALELWYNGVPAGRTVACQLSPIKALPLVRQRLSRPALTLAGRTVTFPVDIETGQYLELRGAGDCKLYNAKGDVLCEVTPEGEGPTLEAGVNQLAFHCAATGCRPRAYVTVISEGDTPLRR
jgi:hypothetical protein